MESFTLFLMTAMICWTVAYCTKLKHETALEITELMYTQEPTDSIEEEVEVN